MEPSPVETAERTPALSPATLSPTEQSRLGELEMKIKQGLSAFLETAEALWEIRERKLYRGAYRKIKPTPLGVGF